MDGTAIEQTNESFWKKHGAALVNWLLIVIFLAAPVGFFVYYTLEGQRLRAEGEIAGTFWKPEKSAMVDQDEWDKIIDPNGNRSMIQIVDYEYYQKTFADDEHFIKIREDTATIHYCTRQGKVFVFTDGAASGLPTRHRLHDVHYAGGNKISAKVSGGIEEWSLHLMISFFYGVVVDIVLLIVLCIGVAIWCMISSPKVRGVSA